MIITKITQDSGKIYVKGKPIKKITIQILRY